MCDVRKHFEALGRFCSCHLWLECWLGYMIEFCRRRLGLAPENAWWFSLVVVLRFFHQLMNRCVLRRRSHVTQMVNIASAMPRCPS